MAAYPSGRGKFFAHRFVRLLAKACVANSIGTDATWLVTVIAMQEDAKRYLGAVTFYNEQLMPVLGIRKWDRLKKARGIAVAEGWLHYEEPPRGTRKPGHYWVTIPKDIDGQLDDSPVDEQELIPQNGISNTDQTQMNRGINRVSTGVSTGGTILPYPNPTPIPEKEKGFHLVGTSPEVLVQKLPTPEKSDTPVVSDSFQVDPLRWQEKFIKAWNSTNGTSKYSRGQLSHLLMREVRTRFDEDPGWDWEKALLKFPLAFWTQQGRKPDLEWFVRSETVRKINDGDTYTRDWKSTNGKPTRDPANEGVPWQRRPEPASVPDSDRGGSGRG